MPKRTPSTEEITKILHTLTETPWRYSERALEEFIDQNHADYGQKVRAKALVRWNQWNS